MEFHVWIDSAFIIVVFGFVSVLLCFSFVVLLIDAFVIEFVSTFVALLSLVVEVTVVFILLIELCVPHHMLIAFISSD